MEETDPEFFKFLQKNDTNLLDFGADDEESDGEDDLDEGDLEDSDLDSDASDSDGDDSDGMDEDDDESIQEGDLTARREKKRIEITVELVEAAAKKALSSDALTELKKLLSMFRTACIPSGESESDLNDGGRSMGDEPLVSRYSIPSAEVYEKVMLTSISTVHEAFSKHLELKTKDLTKAGLTGLEKRPKWKKLQLLVISYFKSIMHTISGLAESTKQNSVALFLVDSLENYIPFLAPLPRLAKNVAKVLLTVWAQQPSLTSVAEATVASADKVDQLTLRGHAFLRIRQISVQLPGALAEECFRSMYLKFARQCKTYNELTTPSVVFMMQSVAELYGTDLALGYQQAFLYIRQLALHLRAALLKKSDETTRQITSMQFLNCLRLWTRVVSAYPSSEDGLGALAFPLAQIMFGVVSAVPSIYYTPLKFNLITCLHQLAAACNLFIPTTSIVVEVLEHPDLVAKPTPSTELSPKLDQMVRLPSNSVAKAVVRDAIVTEAVQLIRQDTEVYRFHVGVPEYLYLTIRKLKAYLKKCKITKWRDIVRNVTGQMESYSTSAQQGRAALSLGPMSVVDFEPLLPNGTQSAKVRLHKLIAGGKSDITPVAHLKPEAKKAPKDLFSSSYSAIKAEQAKAAGQKRNKAQKKGGDTDSEGDRGSDEESGDEADDADSMEDGDNDDYSDESGDSFREQSDSEGELGSDFDSEAEEEEEEAPPKAAAKAPASAQKNPSAKKGKKARPSQNPAIDSMQDAVGSFDWDDEDDRF